MNNPNATIERKHITITKVETQQPIGDKGAIKLAFIAKNGDGKDAAYFTFSKALFDYIKDGAVIDADVEISTREFNNYTYTDRKVTQIYENGAPVGAKKFPFAGGSRGTTPEDRLSIEMQVAAKIGSELLCAGVIPMDCELSKLTIAYCVDKLKQSACTCAAPAVIPAPVTPAPVSRPTPSPAPAPTPAPRTAAKPAAGAPVFDTVGEFFTRAWTEFRLNRPRVMELLAISGTGEIDLQKDWPKLVAKANAAAEKK